jgi:hypothetical protein
LTSSEYNKQNKELKQNKLPRIEKKKNYVVAERALRRTMLDGRTACSNVDIAHIAEDGNGRGGVDFDVDIDIDVGTPMFATTFPLSINMS